MRMSLDEIEITAISHGGVKGTYIERSKTARGFLFFLEGRFGDAKRYQSYHLSLFCLHATVLQVK